LLALAGAAGAAAADGRTWHLWRLEGGRLHSEPADDDRPRPVGSLQKPFVAKAWALVHPGTATPLVRCGPSSGCWRPGGHGRLDLTRALAVSCNTYFLRLARETPPDVLAATFADEGFLGPESLTAESAVGHVDGSAVRIRPSALLAAYARLTREPWASGEGVRREVAAGLRRAALDGTAAGLGRRGLLAKTGTVPSLDGRALATSGWALAVDDAGWTVLALLRDGTGREAARALGAALDDLRPGLPLRDPRARRRTPGDPVRVALFGALRPRDALARNVGDSPAATSQGWIGPGGSLALGAGDRLGDALWELELPRPGLRRRLRGALAVMPGASGTVELVAEVAAPEYVAGVARAEWRGGEASRRTALAAAVLRFLAAGARHAGVDVCDTTHCAWFVGRGPRPLWPTPEQPLLPMATPPNPDAEALTASWGEIVLASREPGPRYWSSHCGGRPLAPHAVWGDRDRAVTRCPLHPSPTAHWRRFWPEHELARAFGGPVAAIVVVEVGGVWTLRVSGALGSRDLRYDDAHRWLDAVARRALPSPATRVTRVAGGFLAEGVGFGHRVGLCLGGAGPDER
jgi:hypothetical protein